MQQLRRFADSPLERCNLRLHEETMRLIDLARAGRPGFLSRNSWIAEAIREKLAKEGIAAPVAAARGANDA